MINNVHFEHFPQLETKRLLLRKPEVGDAAAIQYIRSHAKAMRYMDSRKHENIEDSESFILENLERYALKKGIFWALLYQPLGEFIGDLAIWKIDRKNSRGEIGYTLNPDFWGKGLMTEALTAVINFGFNDLQLHSFEANINPDNENSRRLLTKLGFKKEAYFRENYYYDGKYLDSEIYSLLKQDLRQ